MEKRPLSAQEDIARHQYFRRGIVDRFEGERAVIELEDGQKIEWPRGELPVDAREGASMRLILSTSTTDTEERERIAKALLNEILPKGATAPKESEKI